MKRRSIVRALAVSAGALALVMMVPVASATHPRPKSGSPVVMSLVPAYAPCAAPNRTHGPPLAFASCHPPAQTSPHATVGTPDAFGGAAKSASHLRLSSSPVPGRELLSEVRRHANRDRAQRRALRADGRTLRHGQRLWPRRLLGRDAILVHGPPHGSFQRDRSGRGHGSATVQDFTTGLPPGMCAERVDFNRGNLQHEHEPAGARSRAQVRGDSVRSGRWTPCRSTTAVPTATATPLPTTPRSCGPASSSPDSGNYGTNTPCTANSVLGVVEATPCRPPSSTRTRSSCQIARLPSVIVVPARPRREWSWPSTSPPPHRRWRRRARSACARSPRRCLLARRPAEPVRDADNAGRL